MIDVKSIAEKDEIIESISAGEGELKVQRSWWCTAASVGFFLFIILVMLPRCVRQKSKASRR